MGKAEWKGLGVEKGERGMKFGGDLEEGNGEKKWKGLEMERASKGKEKKGKEGRRERGMKFRGSLCHWL